jgi:hypothetical protein
LAAKRTMLLATTQPSFTQLRRTRWKSRVD